ncbi:hypothetical protein GPECTOR_2g1589 [Gonium pectorale]|uniref:Nephrocystin 3-like N-terminal domain-containing protein n=1 Tax=Gonium pectorale TaxID=33097 RepID=A0A150H1L1_GONPE|nr:hypothetical protein GPECTOR_2g1589 [Gonium pectorale]|eukprot:KXZ56037.1 hypothetical protein GPECTOR_2g1589 [Gonium pectorale]
MAVPLGPLLLFSQTAVQEIDLRTVHSIVERRKSTVDSAQASKVIPDVDLGAPAGAIVSCGPPPVVEAQRRRSQGFRSSVDGQQPVGRQRSVDGLPYSARSRASADGSVVGWAASSLAPASPTVGRHNSSSLHASSVTTGGSTINGGASPLIAGNGIILGSVLDSPLRRGSTGGTGAVTGILKSNSKEGAGSANRSVRNGGGGTRSITFKDAEITKTFVEQNKDDDDLADEDFYSDDAPLGVPSINSAGNLQGSGGNSAPGSGGGLGVGDSGNLSKRLRTGSILLPMRLESLSEASHRTYRNDVLAAPSISIASRAGSQALLPKKPLLTPSKLFKSADSHANLGQPAASGLPPVKQTGHRSIGSRSVGMRSEVSFAVSSRDVATPFIRGVRSGASITFPARGESGVSMGADSQGSGVLGDGFGPGEKDPLRRSRLSRMADQEGHDSDVPGSAGEEDTGRASRRPPKRGGKEWDAKGARWRRASAFQSSAHCAISLRFLRLLLTEHALPLAASLNIPLTQLTTAMVNEMVVKKLTYDEQCRLVDVPGLVPVEDVGEPDYFISHAWSNPFAHLVQSVCDHLSGALDSTKVWIDIAAVNQHPTEQQQDDLANLRNAISKSKATLMCLDVTGAPLKRVWCLYECDNTITIHGPDRLSLLTPNFSVKDMASVFKSISVVDAGAYKQSDKDKILEDIIAHHGSTTAFDNKLKLLFLLEPLDMETEMESLLDGTGGAQEYDFSALQLWLTSPRAPQVCVISGPAGAGKSTISAALSFDEEAQRRRQKAMAHTRGAVHGPSHMARQISGLSGNTRGPVVHAYHFCKYSDVRRQSPIRIVKTLAYQLAQRLPLLRSYYAGLDLAQVQQLHQASTAFRLLLLKPLTTLLPRDEQVVLLIDAMDEADTHSQLPLDNPVLQLMLHQLSCLPRNVRLITSTRSAPHLMGPLRRKFHGALELTPAMVRRKETTLSQVERRLMSRFGRDAAAAVIACGGGESNLVYYSVVMLLDPPLEKEAVPTTLGGCYNAVFEATWPKLTPQQRGEAIKVLQVLMAAREPLQLSLLAGLGLEHVLELLPGWGILLYEREYKVYTLHKSLHDWLADPAAAGEFHADPRIGHATLGRYLFNAAHPLPEYGAKYLVTHLLAAGKLRELLDQAVTDLDHLEAACRVGYVFRLHAELAAAEPKSRAVADVVRWLGLNSHVLWAHPSAVVQLANEAPNSSAFMIALRRPRRSSTITSELIAASTADGMGGIAANLGSAPPVTLLNKRRTWPAQLSILAQHHRAVNSVAFNPNGTLLASGSEDRSVRLWDPLTGEQKAVLFGHTGQVLGVAFSPNGGMIASASVDSTVRLWDASTGEAKGELAGHVDWVRDVAFAPAAGTSAAPGAPGKLLASCGDDKTVKLWELSGPQPSLRSSMSGHTDVVYSVAFHPDGTLLASGSADQSIRLWDPATGRQVGRALVAHKFPVTTVAFSPDGKLLASGSHDKLIMLWDMTTCRETGTPCGELAGHTDKVLNVAFAPDSVLMVSASADGSMRIWDMVARRVRGVLLGHASSVVAAAFAPGGALIASAASDYTVRLWDPRVACESGSVEEASVSHMDSVTSVCFSPSGHTVASAGADWTVRLWDPSDGNHRTMLQGHTDVVRCVAFSPTGHLLASASSDWTVRLWDPVSKMETGVLTGHQDRVLTVAWSPNSRMLASACHSGVIVVWDAVTMDMRHQLKGHAAPVTSLAFAPNCKMLASGSSDKTVRVWQVQLGEQQVLLKGHNGGVNGVEFDSTGKLLASASLEEKMVRVWDPATGVLLCVITNAALCSPGTFSMYSLERHAPFVRAISLRPRAGNGSGGGAAVLMGSGGGGTAAAAGAAGAPSSSPQTASVAAFGRSPSFTPQQMLQPSMTMRGDRDRSSPNGFILGPGSTAMDGLNFAFSAQSAPQLGASLMYDARTSGNMAAGSGYSSNNGGVPRLSGGGAATVSGFASAVGGGGSGGPSGPPSGAVPSLQHALSMRGGNLNSMDEVPRLMELVSDAESPIVPIFTQFVTPRCVAIYGNKVVMSDGPHLYFFESNEGKIVGWKSRVQSAAM